MKLYRYLVLITGGLTTFYILVIWAWLTDWPIHLTAVAISIFLLTHLPIMVFTFRMWQPLQDGHARMTPVQSVGRFFLPGYNFYWLFQTIYGFAVDANTYLKRHHIQALPVPERIYLWYVILWLLAAIPYVGIVTIPICLVFVTIIIFTATRTLNTIQAKQVIKSL